MRYGIFIEVGVNASILLQYTEVTRRRLGEIGSPWIELAKPDEHVIQPT